MRILELLCASSHTRDELHKELNIHRTTLRRNLRELMERSWVESLPSTNAYRALPAGQIIVESLQEIFPEIRIAVQLDEFLPLLPDEIQTDTCALRGCTVTRCDEKDPHAPSQRFLILIQETESFHGFTPIFNPLYVEPFETRIARDRGFEIIAPPNYFQRLRYDFASALETALDAASTQLLVSDALPQFGVGLLDDGGVIATYDQSMRLHSLLEADSTQQPVIDWIEHQYEKLKKTATEYESWAENAAKSR